MMDSSELRNNREPYSDELSDASAYNVLTVSGEIDPSRAHTQLHLPEGQILHVPTEMLSNRCKTATEEVSTTRSQPPFAGDSVVIPVIEEQLRVGKRTVATGKVLLEKHVQEYQETLDVPLAVRAFDVERVVLNRHIDNPPPVRQEGDTTIYSLVEEQLVLTTQLILKEEVRVTKRDTERRDTRTVTLKRESLTVTRSPIDTRSGTSLTGDEPSRSASKLKPE